MKKEKVTYLTTNFVMEVRNKLFPPLDVDCDALTAEQKKHIFDIQRGAERASNDRDFLGWFSPCWVEYLFAYIDKEYGTASNLFQAILLWQHVFTHHNEMDDRLELSINESPLSEIRDDIYRWKDRQEALLNDNIMFTSRRARKDEDYYSYVARMLLFVWGDKIEPPTQSDLAEYIEAFEGAVRQRIEDYTTLMLSEYEIMMKFW